MKPLYNAESDFRRPLHKYLKVDSDLNDGVPPSIRDYARIIHSQSFRKLQGKMQLFPVGESDVLRTRLTHSIEVSEVAMRIAAKINLTHDYFKEFPIDLHLVATAALAHDFGHPPFGHSGELALHQKSPIEDEGYEGNAQTLRIVTRLENRLSATADTRDLDDVYNNPFGLNLTYRTLASLIKYDSEIAYNKAKKTLEWRDQGALHEEITHRFHDNVIKGYYRDDKPIVDDIKYHVLGHNDPYQRLLTVECQIMDIADDIAYSTYDLEDAMICGEIQPFDILSADDETINDIVHQVNRSLKKQKYTENLRPVEAISILTNIFDRVLHFAEPRNYNLDELIDRVVFVGRSYKESQLHAKNHLIRRKFTETLIDRSVESITITLNEDFPSLSEINLPLQNFLEIECLKAFNFFTVIKSPRLRTYNYRANEIIKGLYELLEPEGREELVPTEMRPYFRLTPNRNARYRQIVDLISGMTDADATSMYERLKSPTRHSVFAPF